MADGNSTGFKVAQARYVHVSQEDTCLASQALVRDRPAWSCSDQVRHRSVLISFTLLAGCGGLLQPILFLELANMASLWGFTVLISMRATLIVRGYFVRRDKDQKEEGAAEVGDVDIWPSYSVLVPLYKEAGSVRGLLVGLKALDYPLEKLEVMFLLEAEDHETCQTLERCDLPAHWPILVLPDGMPRTKPRALNVALGKLRGEIATIYDAEDRPHPGQLKAAVMGLRNGHACVQAPLQAYNARASWVAGQWGLEYDTHFGLILPALADAARPIALGGTSNHFCVQSLREAGGWDAWNVTEDADLGLRFARLGNTIGTISPPTLEEAPETLSVWFPQRSRWIKGYMQSASVILRQPVLAARQMGAGSLLASQILLGGAILSACLHGPFALFCLLCLILPGFALAPACAALLLAGCIVTVLAALLAPGCKDRRRIVLALSSPLYWPLQSIAAARALYELATDPYVWSKTPHALTRLDVSHKAFTHI